MIKYSKKFFLVIAIVTTLVLTQTSIFAKKTEQTSDTEKAYAHCTVIDIDTRETCKNAKIKYVLNGSSDKSIKTDKNGEYVFEKLDIGTCDWYIECDGYKNATYISYPVNSGENFYKFEVAKDQAINSTFVYQTYTESDSIEPYPVSEVVSKLKNNGDKTFSINGWYSTPGPTAYLPSRVRVYRQSINRVVLLPLDEYLQCVVPTEMNPNQSIYNGMTDSQKLRALKAQAIVARGYAVYHYYCQARHSGSGYDFCDGQHCQVYNPNYTHSLATQAVNETTKRIPALVSGQPYSWNVDYIDSVFAASCNGSTRNSEDAQPYFSNYCSYLRGVSCPYDIRPSLISGHRVGLCQDGAAGYAKNTSLIPELIIAHYYTGAQVITGQYQ